MLSRYVIEKPVIFSPSEDLYVFVTVASYNAKSQAVAFHHCRLHLSTRFAVCWTLQAKCMFDLVLNLCQVASFIHYYVTTVTKRLAAQISSTICLCLLSGLGLVWQLMCMRTTSCPLCPASRMPD